MRYLGKRKSNQDNEHTVFNFELGRHEGILLKELLSKHIQATRGIIETQISKNRAQNMRKIIGRALEEHD